MDSEAWNPDCIVHGPTGILKLGGKTRPTGVRRDTPNASESDPPTEPSGCGTRFRPPLPHHVSVARLQPMNGQARTGRPYHARVATNEVMTAGPELWRADTWTCEEVVTKGRRVFGSSVSRTERSRKTSVLSQDRTASDRCRGARTGGNSWTVERWHLDERILSHTRAERHPYHCDSPCPRRAAGGARWVK
jgi:hypothetical protein